jgi:hypothetical protein
MRTSKAWFGAVVSACLVMALGWAAPAGAGTVVYPNGGSGFTGGPEGWTVAEASCSVPLSCTASGGYSEAQGNPAGSLSADADVLLNLLSVFEATVVLQSPDFTVSRAGATTLHLDRAFQPGGLLNLGPEVAYSVRLIDRTAGTESTPLTETIAAATGWGGADGAASVKAGHTYALAITATTRSTLVNLTVSGSSSVRFDNVGLAVESADATGGGGGSTGGGVGPGSLAGLSAPHLRQLIKRNSLSNRVLVRGSRLFVRAKCPKRIGRACRISVQGMFGKRKAVTTRRNVRVGKGARKRILLRIKPKFRAKVAKRGHLMFKQTVRVGTRKVTVYKRLRLIRHNR